MQDLALWICLPDLDITKSDIMVDTTKSDIVMVDQAGQKKGWTGFTWDKRLFPDPEQFIAKLHSLGLKVTLNLHPASGVQPWEDSYQTVAELMGICLSLYRAMRLLRDARYQPKACWYQASTLVLSDTSR